MLLNKPLKSFHKQCQNLIDIDNDEGAVNVDLGRNQV